MARGDKTEKGIKKAGYHTRPIIEIDFAKYLQFTKGFDATEEEQRELITALHKIMLTFVDMGFDLSPVQHVDSPAISCEQNSKQDQENPQEFAEVIQSLIASDSSLTATFDAQRKGASAIER